MFGVFPARPRSAGTYGVADWAADLPVKGYTVTGTITRGIFEQSAIGGQGKSPNPDYERGALAGSTLNSSSERKSLEFGQCSWRQKSPLS